MMVNRLTSVDSAWIWPDRKALEQQGFEKLPILADVFAGILLTVPSDPGFSASIDIAIFNETQLIDAEACP